MCSGRIPMRQIIHATNHPSAMNGPSTTEPRFSVSTRIRCMPSLGSLCTIFCR